MLKVDFHENFYIFFKIEHLVNFNMKEPLTSFNLDVYLFVK
jgi:hypothetical protein